MIFIGNLRQSQQHSDVRINSQVEGKLSLQPGKTLGGFWPLYIHQNTARTIGDESAGNVRVTQDGRRLEKTAIIAADQSQCF